MDIFKKLNDKNVIFITLDSCRFDTAERAKIPTLKSIGVLRKAYTHATYTVPAHTAFFAGHLPNVFDNPQFPYYSESVSQLWRIKTGKGKDREAGIVFKEQDVLEGYRKIGFYVLGAGGVSQFSDGSFLRNFFGNEFLYFGQKLDEEPLQSRNKESFPLNNIEEIVKKIINKEKWFLFINCPETHYPYDIGDGIPKNIVDFFPKLFRSLNLRENDEAEKISSDICFELHNMQIKALEHIDGQIKNLINTIPRNKDVLVVICGDHGENFGEIFKGKKRFGHLIPSMEVMEVPLIIGVLNKK